MSPVSWLGLCSASPHSGTQADGTATISNLTSPCGRGKVRQNVHTGSWNFCSEWGASSLPTFHWPKLVTWPCWITEGLGRYHPIMCSQKEKKENMCGQLERLHPPSFHNSPTCLSPGCPCPRPASLSMIGGRLCPHGNHKLPVTFWNYWELCFQLDSTS